MLFSVAHVINEQLSQILLYYSFITAYKFSLLPLYYWSISIEITETDRRLMRCMSAQLFRLPPVYAMIRGQLILYSCNNYCDVFTNKSIQQEEILQKSALQPRVILYKGKVEVNGTASRDYSLIFLGTKITCMVKDKPKNMPKCKLVTQ